jgi:hypothetical protein
VKNRDAIWPFVNRPRPKSSEPTIELALVVDPDDYNRAEAHRERQIEEVELSEEVQVSRATYISVAVQSYLFKQDFTIQGRQAKRQGRRSKRHASTDILSPTVLASAPEVVRVAFSLITY